MTLVALANQMYDLLMAVDEEDWLVSDLPFRKCLDPLTEMSDGIQGVFIIPITVDYNLEQSNKRVSVKQVSASPRIAVAIAKPFASRDSSGFDVSTWSEVESLLNFREQLDLVIINGMDHIQAVESEPPIETTFDKRWYLSITEFIFEEMKC